MRKKPKTNLEKLLPPKRAGSFPIQNSPLMKNNQVAKSKKVRKKI